MVAKIYLWHAVYHYMDLYNNGRGEGVHVYVRAYVDACMCVCTFIYACVFCL